MPAINTKKLSNSNLMVVMLLVTLLVLGVAALLTKTLVGTVVRDTKVLQKKAAAEKQLDKNIAAAPSLVSEYEKLGDKAVVVADALPNSVDLPSLMVTMENIAATSGTKLVRITPDLGIAVAKDAPVASNDPTVTPNPTAYRFGLSLSGSYPSILKFLAGLETSARPIRVIDAQFTGSGSSLNAEITADTYYQDKAKLPFGTETIK